MEEVAGTRGKMQDTGITKMRSWEDAKFGNWKYRMLAMFVERNYHRVCRASLGVKRCCGCQGI